LLLAAWATTASASSRPRDAGYPLNS